MLSESRDFLYVAWWLAAFPGAALALTALGVNLRGRLAARHARSEAARLTVSGHGPAADSSSDSTPRPTPPTSTSGATGVERWLGGLSDDQMRRRPGEGLNSIVWLLWHMARTEDVAVNLVVAARAQVFDDGWARRMNVARPDMGTGMTAAEVADLSEQADVAAVRAYRSAVGLRTREVVQTLAPGGVGRDPEPRGHDARRRGRRVRAERRLDRGRGPSPLARPRAWPSAGPDRHSPQHRAHRRGRHDPRAGRLRPSACDRVARYTTTPNQSSTREKRMGRTRRLVVVALVVRPSSRSSARLRARPGPRQDEGDRRRARRRAAHHARRRRSWTGRPTTCSSTSTTGCSTATPRPSSPSRCWPTSWKIVNDTTWEFKLRKGVKFHNGEPFTAASVKATIDYALDPATKTPLRGRRLLGPGQGSPGRRRLHRALHHQAAVAEPGRQRGVHQLAHDAGQGAEGARARPSWPRSRSAPARSSSSSGSATSGWCSSATPTTGRARPTPAGSPSASSPSSARAWPRCSRARSTS